MMSEEDGRSRLQPQAPWDDPNWERDDYRLTDGTCTYQLMRVDELHWLFAPFENPDGVVWLSNEQAHSLLKCPRLKCACGRHGETT